jgi:hypothetical protein
MPLLLASFFMRGRIFTMPKKLILVLTITLLIFPFSKVTAADQKYWNPGHYITLVDNSTKSQIISEIEQLNTNDYRNIKGVKIKMWWKDFEPSQGNYDYSDLDSYIQALPEGKQIFILLLNRDFQKSCSNNPRIPSYIVNHSKFPAEDLGNNGCIAQVWQQEIADEYISLLSYIGKRYGDNPKFGGLMLEETAVSVDFKTYAGSKTEFNTMLFDQTVRMHTEASRHFGKAFLMQKINWLTGNHPDHQGEEGACGMLIPLTDIVMNLGGAITNPDTVLEKTIPESDPCRPLPPYEIYRSYKGKIPIMVGNDTSQLGDPNNLFGKRTSFNGKAMTMDNLVESLYYAMVPGFNYRGDLIEGFGANYIFWNKNFWSKEGKSQQGYEQAVLGFINSTGAKTIETCPSNIECVSLSGANPTPVPSGNIPTPTPPTPSPTIKYDSKYDLNNDNKVNLQDVIAVIKFIFG